MSSEADKEFAGIEVREHLDGTAEAVPSPLPPAVPLQVSGPRMEKLIGMTLLFGVLFSTLMVAFGGVVYVSRHATAIVDYRVFRGDHSDLRSLAGVWKGAKAFSGRGIIQLGLMLLVGLQVVRVMLTGVVFFAGRDWVFVAVTTVVLALLAYGLVFESAGVH